MVVLLLVWWLWIPVLLGTVWVISKLALPGMALTKEYELMVRTILLHGAYPLAFIVIGLVGTAVIVAVSFETEHDNYREPRSNSRLYHLAIASVLIVGLVVSGLWFRVLWDNDKDLGRYYANATSFYVSDINEIPDSLLGLTDGAVTGEDCDLLGAHDVRGCVRQGELSKAGWDARVSSFTGARIAMQRKVGERQRVSLATETVTYLNAYEDTPATWSGILDGSGREQSLAGVAQWSGEGDATTCIFEGDYAIKRAFNGERGNSLPNLIAEQYSDVNWNINDAWGYCSGSEPIIVIPVTKPIRWMDRTVDTAAGIITVRGKNGDVSLEYVADVEAGTYPGPVYPNTLVARQRNEMQWTAGRKQRDRFSFGYDPSESEAQSGNVSEYLLRDAETGRLMYVTPLTLRSSTSEVFVAYATTHADEVYAGQLNELSVYVLEDGNPRRINIDTLAAEAGDWMSRNNGTFRSNGGALIEFTPVDGDIWRVFGEMNGQVVYRLDISASRRIAPELVSLGAYDSGPTSEPAPTDGAAAGRCTPDLASLSQGDLAACMSDVAAEVARRLNGG